MNRTLIVTGLLLVGAAACSRSTTPEQAPVEPLPATPAAAPVEMPAEVPAEMAAEVPAEMPAEIPIEVPAEAPPPAPTDHRLRLGVDGDPGYAQKELTPEELAEANAAAAAEPSYPVEPTEPSQPEQPTEDSGGVVEGSSDTVYMGERRAPIIRHEVRREDDVREDVEEEHRGEARPVVRGRR